MNPASSAAMTSRQRVARTLARQQPDRVPIYDSFWMEAECEFRRQLGCSLPPDESKLFTWDNSLAAARSRTIWEIFDMDLIQIGWPDCYLHQRPEIVVEETDEWVIYRNGDDALFKSWKHKMGTPERVSFAVNSPDKWREVRHLLVPSRQRIDWEVCRPVHERARADDRYVCYATLEAFEAAKNLLGHEMMLKAMIKQPEWLQEIFETYTTLQIGLFELCEAEGLHSDGAFLYGDLAYKNGPFMSPDHYRRFVKPSHKRMGDYFAARGMPVIFHTDGDIRPLIDDLIDAGVNALNPLEAKAGVDVRQLAGQYGDRLGFVGNIDARILATNDREAIREELRTKLAATMPYCGYIYHSDHSVPPGVTLETYQQLLDDVRTLGRYD
ncbi:MAG: hypothetical protein JSV91_11300 [Phycisphaerales bacterium]|nr:MAG: hypothetical protein JSV91_11300 [Phycisphaerales bacterium]